MPTISIYIFIHVFQFELDVEQDVNECPGLNAQESPVVRGEPGVEGVVGHLNPGSTSWKKLALGFVNF